MSHVHTQNSQSYKIKIFNFFLFLSLRNKIKFFKGSWLKNNELPKIARDKVDESSFLTITA